MKSGIKILAFGITAEILGGKEIVFPFFSGSDELRKYLLDHFPGMEKINYAIAVNKNMVIADTKIEAGDEIALLPPFAGG